MLLESVRLHTLNVCKKRVKPNGFVNSSNLCLASTNVEILTDFQNFK